MTVIDLGYRTGPLADIDTVPVEQWRSVFVELCRSAGPGPVIGHPTTWGAPRLGVLRRALGDLGIEATLLPRAVLIAQSHADPTAGRVVVVETTHLPRQAPGIDHGWDVTRLDVGPDGRRIIGSEVWTRDDRNADAGPATELVDDTVTAIFVDGDEPAEVAAALDWLAGRFATQRIVAVDRNLIARHGIPVRLPEWTDPEPLPPAPSRRRRLVLAATGIAVAVITVLVVAGGGGPAPAAAEDRQLRVGEISVPVPAPWKQSDLPGLNGGQAAREDAAARTVVADPRDGRRLIVVTTPVRAGSTLESVAASLRSRIEQRGTAVVAAFSASTRYGDREVISYRETPVSGPAVHWYVQLAGDLQVSIGCQDGEAGQPVEPVCRRAVSGVV